MVDTVKGFISKTKKTIATQRMTYQGTHLHN